MFGIDVANSGFFRAMVRSPEFAKVSFLVHERVPPEELRSRFMDDGGGISGEIESAGLFNTSVVQAAGTLLRGTANLSDLAWLRRETAGDRGYSLVGLIHCVAPPALRQEIANTTIAPTQPWDALICTSPAVRDVAHEIFAEWTDYIAGRFEGNRQLRPTPLLPLIPLGVDCERIAAAADRPATRAKIRAELEVSAEDVLVLWVGRLSFFEKA